MLLKTFRDEELSYPVEANLVLAARASGDLTGLGVGLTELDLLTLNHHLGEVDIGADRVLVTHLTGVDAGGIGGVTSEGLEGVEVGGRTGGVGVPRGVKFLLGIVVEHLLVILSVLEVEAHGLADAVKGGRKGSGRGGEGNDSKGLELVTLAEGKVVWKREEHSASQRRKMQERKELSPSPAKPNRTNQETQRPTQRRAPREVNGKMWKIAYTPSHS